VSPEMCLSWSSWIYVEYDYLRNTKRLQIFLCLSSNGTDFVSFFKRSEDGYETELPEETQ
jgi:hypothetical protein